MYQALWSAGTVCFKWLVIYKITPLTAVPVVASSETTISNLFKKWQALYESLHGTPDEVCDAGYEKMNAIAEEMALIPSICASDIASKVLAATCYGDFGFDQAIGREILIDLMRHVPKSGVFAS